jgi:catechol 2,3-dioxygenase-like lactoylglutathione lyase family enzyme
VFDHLDIAAGDIEASRAFYVRALGEPTADKEWVEWDNDFGIRPADAGHPLTGRLHVAFGVATRDDVDAWWRHMADAGYTSDGEPGPRPEYSATYYGGFILDPDGNSIEAVHHDNVRPGTIDHVWFRSRDVAAQKRFYETVAPVVGLRVAHDEPARLRITDGEGSFTYVPGEPPTEHVHLAFKAPDRETVDAFHRVALAAGCTDNGAPGERSHYHPGYYGAFVFDPDGHNVEAVYHDR